MLIAFEHIKIKKTIIMNVYADKCSYNVHFYQVDKKGFSFLGIYV